MNIKQKISLAGGLTTFLAIASLSVFSVIEMRVLQQGIEQRVSQSMLSGAQQALQSRLQLGAESAQKILRESMNTANGLALSATSLAQTHQEGEAIRDKYSALLRQTLQANPDLLGTYMLLEPNAVDGADDKYRGKHEQAYDDTGRYIPYFTLEKGEISVTASLDYENTDRSGGEDRAGEYYLCPRDTLNTCLLEPFLYPVNGQDIFLTSLVSPMLIDGKFVGMAGVDIALDKLSALAQRVSTQLYASQSKVYIVTDRATVTGHSANTSGQALQEDAALKAQLKAALSSGESVTAQSEDGANLWSFTPIKAGEGLANWGVYASVPKAVVLAEMGELEQFIGAEMRALIVGLLVMGAVLIALAIAVIWYFAKRISTPIVSISGFFSKVAAGDFTARVSWNSLDETGDLARACNSFLDQVQPVMIKVASSSADISEQSQATKRVAEQTLAGASRQQSELSALAAAAEELGATASNVAEHALEASQMTDASQQSASSGQQVLDNADSAVSSLAQNISQVADSVIALQEDSNNINSILDVIRTIADQTNLLALNAAIEAARAGEQGRGFAVVADEVRSLAQRTQDSTMEIQTMLEGLSEGAARASSLMLQSREQAGHSTQAMQQTREQLSEILASVSNIHLINTQVASAAQQQTVVAQEISHNLSGISEVSSANAQGAQEANVNCDNLADLSNTLALQVGQFKL
ncbi:MAG: methyl-accepting chemotaxis protein [Pseudomonadales bacterium]